MQENEIKSLLQIQKDLSEMKSQKKEQIEKLETEIDSMSSMIYEINQLISTRSFTTAESMLVESMDVEDAAKQSPKYTENLHYNKKIFSNDKENLLVDLRFQHNSIIIIFSSPEITKIRQDEYINQFVKPTLVNLKKVETDLTPSISKSFYGENEYIDRIKLQHVNNFESFEFIVEKMEDFIKSLNNKK